MAGQPQEKYLQISAKLLWWHFNNFILLLACYLCHDPDIIVIINVFFIMILMVLLSWCYLYHDPDVIVIMLMLYNTILIYNDPDIIVIMLSL